MLGFASSGEVGELVDQVWKKCVRGVGCERSEVRVGRRNARGVAFVLGFFSLSSNQ